MSGSQRKDGRRVAVSEVSVRDALRADTSALAPEEEQILRLRQGVGLAPGRPLQAKATGSTLEVLRQMEVDLHRRFEAHLNRPQPQPSEVKDRIVRALRRKR